LPWWRHRRSRRCCGDRSHLDSRSYVVKICTLARAASLVSLRVAAMPSITGIRISGTPCPTQLLERHAAQHRRAADLEAAILVDKSVCRPLPYHATVFEVIGECRLRCIRRYASHISHRDRADRIPESLVRPASTRMVGLVGRGHAWPRCISVARHQRVVAGDRPSEIRRGWCAPDCWCGRW
jgi:hypothetical protein